MWIKQSEFEENNTLKLKISNFEGEHSSCVQNTENLKQDIFTFAHELPQTSNAFMHIANYFIAGLFP